MAQVYANNLYTVTVGDITSVATTISINSNAGFPVLAVGDWFYVTLTAPKGSVENQWEIVKVTAHTATSITVVRAQDGTVPVGWANSTGVSGRVVAGDMNTTEAFKNSAGAVSGIATLDNTGKLTTTQIPVIASAGKLTTGRTIALTGPVTGSVLFDGSADASIAVTVTPDGHTHTISNISDWPVAITAVELNYVDGATSNIQTQLNGKSSTSHTHTLDNLSDVSIVAPATTHELYYTGTEWANRIKPVIDHSSLSGLSTGDPHAQYLNTARANSLYASLASPVLTGTPTAPTAALGTDTDQIATTAFVLANSVSTLADLGVTTATASELNLVSGVTSAIQTQLNGKAPTVHTHTVSQISDWPTAVTMTEVGYIDGVTSAIQTQLDTKAPLASPAFTGTPTTPTAAANTNTTQVASTAFVEAATTPAQLLIDIKTVDGSGSGLDADLLDGLDSSAFYRIIAPDYSGDLNDATVSGMYRLSTTVTNTPPGAGVGDVVMHQYFDVDTALQQFYDSSTDNNYTRRKNLGTWKAWVKAWNEATDGAGSGLDADLLDGLNSTQFLRSDTDATITGVLSVTGQVNAPQSAGISGGYSFVENVGHNTGMFSPNDGQLDLRVKANNVISSSDTAVNINVPLTVGGRISAYQGIGSLNGVIPTAATQTLLPSVYGKAIQVHNGATITLPVGSGVSGDLIYFFNSDGVSYTISANANQFIFAPSIGLYSAANGTVLNLPGGDSVILASRGNGEFNVIGGSVLVSQATRYAVSRAENGYQKLPGGLIIQWGIVQCSGSGSVTWTYPIAFPSAVGSVGSIGTLASSPQFSNISSTTLTSVLVSAWDSNGGRTGNNVFMLAVGY